MKNLIVLGVVIILALLAGVALADGTETLGAPSIDIKLGSGLVAGGVGLAQSPGVGFISVDVPPGATINQVLIYWSGEYALQDDDDINVHGNVVQGQLIGGPTQFYLDEFGTPVYLSTYRADITELGLVASGSNSIQVADLDYDRDNGGAGILVIFSGTKADGETDLRDGQDLAFYQFAPTLNTTVPQTFEFDTRDYDRVFNLILFASSVGGTNRPNRVMVQTNGTVNFYDVLASNDGDYWDTATVPVTVPAGEGELTVQVLSEEDASGGLPASLNWIAAGLSPPGPPTAITLAALDGGLIGGGGSVTTWPLLLVAIVGLFTVFVLWREWGKLDD